MQPPADFLKEQGQAAKDIATEAGLEQPPIADGQRVAGIYHHSAKLASRRCAMLNDDRGVQPGAVEADDRAALGAATRRDGAPWKGVMACQIAAWRLNFI